MTGVTKARFTQITATPAEPTKERYMNRKSVFFACAAVALAVPAIAQVAMPGSALPGAPEAARVMPGSYKVDANHTQVVWTLNHMGITPLSGDFAASGGSLNLDPAHPEAATVTVDFNLATMTTLVPAFTTHLLSADILDAVKYPTANFTSTGVKVSGAMAKITGNLTLHGVTKPVVLDARFYGAGDNPRSKKLNIGFSATTTIKRSDFGIMYGPTVADQVNLEIHAAFEKAA